MNHEPNHALKHEQNHEQNHLQNPEPLTRARPYEPSGLVKVFKTSN